MRRVWPLLAVVCYLGLALYQTWPAWLDGGHAVIGQWTHPDMISNHWLYRWLAEALWSGGSILHNDRYYAPVGDGPWLAGNGSDAVPYALLTPFLDWPGSVTFWVILAIVLNGLSGWALARRLGGGHEGALVAGAGVAFSPYIAEELAGARFAQVPIYWIGFFLVAWIGLLERAPEAGAWRPDRGLIKRGLVAGLLFGGAAFSYWYAGLWAALAGGVFFAFRPRWRALVPFVPVALATTIPPLAVFLVNWAKIPGTAEGSFPHPLAVSSSLPLAFPVFGGPGFWGGIILPLALILPALAALFAPLVAAARAGAPRRARGWLKLVRDAWRTLPWGYRASAATALLFYLLCLGPYPSWHGGAGEGVPGPFWLLYGVGGPLRRFWWPYRHIAVLTLALAPLAARGLEIAISWLAGQVEPRLRRAMPAAAAIGLTLLLPFDVGARQGTLSAPVSYFEPPEAYDALAALPGDVVLELPISPPLVCGQQTLSYQWIHHKRLMNGHAMWVDRVRPAAWDAWVRENGFLTDLMALEQGEHEGPFEVAPADLEVLRGVGLRYFVVNVEYYPSELAPLVAVYRELFGALFGEPVVDVDAELYAWDISTLQRAGPVETLPVRLPVALRGERDGGRLPLAGEINSLGWKNVDRRFPPELPPREEEAATEDEDKEDLR